ncbi:MAG: hypothetical protein QNJ51_01950 [Calothrix sp. MO_167.B12]|nr:hypothetical protein [Calothrix sp. MO_167.B12]
MGNGEQRIAYQEASAIERDKARLALCPFDRNLPFTSSYLGLLKKSLGEGRQQATGNRQQFHP